MPHNAPCAGGSEYTFCLGFLLLLSVPSNYICKGSFCFAEITYPDKQKKKNALADKYNTEGEFPLTVLLDNEGNVIKKWSGFYTKGSENFVNEIKQLDAHSNN